MDPSVSTPDQAGQLIPGQAEGVSYTPAAKPKRWTFRRLASGALVTIGLILLKLKALVLLAIEQGRLLLVNPFEGFGAWRFAVAGGSMLVTIAAYARQYRLGLVIGFVDITAIHELGHLLVIRAKGLRPGWVLFIPFLGGATTSTDQPRRSDCRNVRLTRGPADLQVDRQPALSADRVHRLCDQSAEPAAARAARRRPDLRRNHQVDVVGGRSRFDV